MLWNHCPAPITKSKHKILLTYLASLDFLVKKSRDSYIMCKIKMFWNIVHKTVFLSVIIFFYKKKSSWEWGNFACGILTRNSYRKIHEFTSSRIHKFKYVCTQISILQKITVGMAYVDDIGGLHLDYSLNSLLA